jgi:predicted ATP-grasp superfamily ATP-dependent carboligase
MEAKTIHFTHHLARTYGRGRPFSDRCWFHKGAYNHHNLFVQHLSLTTRKVMVNSQISPAVVIGGGSANGLGIARNLGRHGIPVYCVTSNPEELTQYSKYCSGFRVVPTIEQNAHVLHHVLQQLAQQFTEPGVLFPTTDTALLTMSQIREELKDYVTFIPAPQIVATMVIKSKFYRSLSVHGVPHPATFDPTELDLRDVQSVLGYPVFLRPAQSLPFFQRFKAKGFIAHNIHQLRQYLHVADQHRMPIMIQEIIPGPGELGYSMRGYVDRESQLMALMALQKLQQPSLFTALTVKRSIPLSQVQGADQVLTEYLQKIKYTGLFFAEWKQDPRDGVMKLLEINARSAGGNAFGAACGMNHILLAYHDALGSVISPIKRYDEGVYGINLLLNLKYQLSQITHGHFTPRMLHPYLQQKQYLLLSRGDGLPFLKALIHTLTTTRLHGLWRHIRP